MRIEIDHDVMPDGRIVAVHCLHTEDPKVQATLQACSGNPAAQAAAGYSVVSKHATANPGETRWQLLLRQLLAVPANDPVKLLNLR